MLEIVEMQCGRLRYDFAQRLDRSAQRFRTGMIDKIEAAARGIVKAIEQGMELRSHGEQEAQKMLALLSSRILELGRIREELDGISKEIDRT